MAEATKRFAVVTGANRGIGLETCRQLCADGVIVVLTARDEKKGVKALENLKESGLSHVAYHQLDVKDPASVASLADFIKTQFGRLDILVNNAAILGTTVKDSDALGSLSFVGSTQGKKVNWSEILIEPFELAEECLNTNYYGPKRMIEALTPLLQLSDSPRIINVSSRAGQLQNITNEWAKGVFSGAEKLSEEMVDEVLNVFRKDFKEGKSWSIYPSAYTVSKAALNAYTRIMANKYPTFYINCVCPGYVKTDMNYNRGILTVEEGAENTVRLALLPDGGPSGQFFLEKEVCEY